MARMCGTTLRYVAPPRLSVSVCVSGLGRHTEEFRCHTEGFRYTSTQKQTTSGARGTAHVL
eukprot:2894657-Rhodomonas_salina.3